MKQKCSCRVHRRPPNCSRKFNPPLGMLARRKVDDPGRMDAFVPFCLFTGAVAALLFAGSSVRADFIQWRYNWTPSTLKVVSDTSPTSFVQLTNEPIGKPNGVQASGDSDIQMT